jgi:hypothetical protein
MLGRLADFPSARPGPLLALLALLHRDRCAQLGQSRSRKSGSPHCSTIRSSSMRMTSRRPTITWVPVGAMP